MKVLLDNKILKLLISNDKSVEIPSSIAENLINAKVDFSWFSLLEYLGCDDLLKDFPKFDLGNTITYNLYNKIIENPSQESMNDLFDQIFVEFLVQIKSLKEIEPDYLLDALQNKPSPHDIFYLTLRDYEGYLVTNPKMAKHDLTLHLAWNVLCSNFGILFHKAPNDPHCLVGLYHLKNCLLQSFHHIYHDGKAVPSFLKLIEAMYLYQAGDDGFYEKGFDKYSFNQGNFSLSDYRDTSPCFYIDPKTSIFNFLTGNKTVVLTTDSVEQVTKRLDLANFVIKEYSNSVKDWKYTLYPVDVVTCSLN